MVCNVAILNKVIEDELNNFKDTRVDGCKQRLLSISSLYVGWEDCKQRRELWYRTFLDRIKIPSSSLLKRCSNRR
jgi:hypothetical protein